MLVDHLIGKDVSLPSSSSSQGINQLSVLTWNILLPNSQDGWWTYKIYSPKNLDPKVPTWEYRQSLLKDRIGTINADVVCLQEISPTSFEQDFGFMADLGYDGHELFKRGRFRPVTFWKTTECRLVTPAVHKDRCLITAFEKWTVSQGSTSDDVIPVESSSHQPPFWYVVNCHLQAGQQGPRRVRQLLEAIKGVLTLARKLKEKNPEESLRLVVCGDFNGGPESGAIRLLEDGVIDKTFLEDEQLVTSEKKTLPLSRPLLDATAAVTSREPPPTLVVAELMSTLMDEPSYSNPVLSRGMIERLQRIYKRLATRPDGLMSKIDVERWLIRINKEVGRGDEFRNAAIVMGFIDANQDDPWEVRKNRISLPEEGILTFEGFLGVYQKELSSGKFWGIAHDMEVLDDPLPDAGVFTSRYDRIYYNGESVQPIAVLDTLATESCPNDREPSDHLPVAVSFRIK
jgi:endonuclease/exonuclease/phosphatase family metal-dependent hydrolase